jgi:hypothetical protein
LDTLDYPVLDAAIFHDQPTFTVRGYFCAVLPVALPFAILNKISQSENRLLDTILSNNINVVGKEGLEPSKP